MCFTMKSGVGDEALSFHQRLFGYIINLDEASGANQFSGRRDQMNGLLIITQPWTNPIRLGLRPIILFSQRGLMRTRAKKLVKIEFPIAHARNHSQIHNHSNSL